MTCDIYPKVMFVYVSVSEYDYYINLVYLRGWVFRQAQWRCVVWSLVVVRMALLYQAQVPQHPIDSCIDIWGTTNLEGWLFLAPVFHADDDVAVGFVADLNYSEEPVAELTDWSGRSFLPQLLADDLIGKIQFDDYKRTIKIILFQNISILVKLKTSLLN